MDTKYYLAVDIGASSGRHILSHVDDGKIVIEEIYRFENNLVKKDNSLIWDIESLVENVKKGIRKCKEIGKIPVSIGIDTWGVDYVLLDKDKREILPAFCYRDSRTQSAVPETEKIISYEELYSLTGIQKQSFNTIYQLYCDKKSGRLDDAEYMLLMPCYLSYVLTGVIENEYTMASTSALVNAESKTWDESIIDRLGFKKSLFTPLKCPGDVVGNFSKEIKEYMGFDSTVVFVPCHDTASAVAACPTEKNDLYVSSGTWSLIGLESEKPIISALSRNANFTNEGGICYRYRFLKNYVGMWMFQSIRRDLDKKYSYDEMMKMAMESPEYGIIDVNDPSIVAPDNMIKAIRDLLKMDDAPLSYVLATVYHSLASSYKSAVEEIEKITDRHIDAIHIVGGGCKDTYLNSLTHLYTGRTVTAGPVETTALGNLISQIMADEKISLDEAREMIKKSFDIKMVE